MVHLKSKMFALLAALFACALAIPASAADRREAYAAPVGTCDGYPRLSIGMAKGTCAGLVAGPTRTDTTRTMLFPRELVQLDDTTWLVTDLGGWGTTRGAVWKLETKRGEPARVSRMLGGLNLPHAIAMGADGKAYVGEMSRIFRFDPRAADPQKTIETVVAGLPDNRLHENRHPLSAFAFASDGALLVNIGAPSDQCLDKRGKRLGDSCPQSESGERAASIRRYAPDGHGGWSREYTVCARGLRNSVALGVHRSGTILQGENSYDFDDALHPFDEVNRIEAGRHYGWPYCYDIKSVTPGWKATSTIRCASSAHTPPVLLLPPHSAPLSLLWYDGAMFPALRGQLLLSLHGFRATGGRIVAYATDERGVPVATKDARYPVYGAAPRAYGTMPSANAFELTPGWDKVAGKRPQGSPVGLAVARDGAIWTADDRAGIVVRIAADRS
ncbi:MAG: PQQ-dependent sugar dehydrogenase [Thermomonas sp.]